MKKMWEGRFHKETNKLLEKFNASITFDKRMYEEDITGSIAHSRMLAKQGIIAEGEQKEIENGLLQIKDEITAIIDEEKRIVEEAGVCEKCGRPFEIKTGRFGKFLACTGYPECKTIKAIPKDKKRASKTSGKSKTAATSKVKKSVAESTKKTKTTSKKTAAKKTSAKKTTGTKTGKK